MRRTVIRILQALLLLMPFLLCLPLMVSCGTTHADAPKDPQIVAEFDVRCGKKLITQILVASDGRAAPIPQDSLATDEQLKKLFPEAKQYYLDVCPGGTVST